ncbi:MAG: DUF2029 domain-containing protein [Acidobacteriia bacterium]|nr:DUF2029 domain-containing protein [Terriglobia bacterium]
MLLASFTAAALVTTVAARYCFVHPEQNDFASFYSGGHALRVSGLAELYREQLNSPLEQPFVRPPAYALLILPFTYLSFPVAFWLWVGVQLLVFGGCLWWAQDWIGWAAALSCFFPPMLLGISHAQDSAVMLAAVVAAFAFSRSERPVLAGLALGLGVVKFHLFLLWPAALIVQRRWKMLAGLIATAMAAVVISISLVGVGGLASYGRLLAGGRLSPATPEPLYQYGISGLWANLHIGVGPIMYVVAGGVAGLSLFAVRQRGLHELFVVVPAASLAIAPHVLYYDPSLLLLSLWIGLSLWSPSRFRLFASALAAATVFSAVAMPKPIPLLGSAGLLTALMLACMASMRGVLGRQSARPGSGAS